MDDNTKIPSSIDELSNPSAAPKKKKAVNLRAEREKDRELVKGIFHYYELPGGVLDFVFKKYKEDPVEKFSLVDGQVYELPYGVAKHLNKNGYYPVHAYEIDERGNPSMRIGKKIKRFGFQSLEFTDIDEFVTDSSRIVSVEKLG